MNVEVGAGIVSPTVTSGPIAMNQMALQRYLLHCAQQLDGGLRGTSTAGHNAPKSM